MIKHALLAVCIALPLAALAEDKKPTPQQQKMAACSKEASAKKLAGDERKKFMSECLSAKPVAAADDKKLTPQQERMRVCNRQAGEKKLEGDARKKFMSECLKAA